MSGYLIVGPSWVGDMVMAQSLIISLKQREPTLPIDVIAPRWSVPIVQRMDEVRDAIPLPVAHGEVGWGKRRALGKSLRCKDYQQAIVLPRSLKSALVPWFVKVPKRTGYRGEWRNGALNDLRTVDKERTPTPAMRWLALGYAPGSPLPPQPPFPHLRPDADNQQRLIEELDLDTGQPVIALVPGAEHGNAKCWPASYFAEVARRLTDSGVRVWLMGSPKEEELADRINSEAQGVATNLCGRTSLPDAVDLLAKAHAVVSNDSGLMHVAASVGSFVVALYGSSTPAYTPPLTDRCRILYLNLECSPCFAQDCPLGHHNCLRQIMPDQVMNALPPELLAR